MTAIRVVAALALALFLGSAAPTTLAAQASIAVKAADFGTEWPLLERAGRLQCRKGSAIVFVAPSGTVYALNAHAKTAGFAALDPIWRDAPNPGAGSRKMSVAPLARRGATLCKKG